MSWDTLQPLCSCWTVLKIVMLMKELTILRKRKKLKSAATKHWLGFCLLYLFFKKCLGCIFSVICQGNLVFCDCYWAYCQNLKLWKRWKLIFCNVDPCLRHWIIPVHTLWICLWLNVQLNVSFANCCKRKRPVAWLIFRSVHFLTCNCSALEPLCTHSKYYGQWACTLMLYFVPS